MNKDELKLELAKLMPRIVRINPAGLIGLFWRDRDLMIQDSELLYLCFLIECEMSLDARRLYTYELGRITQENRMATVTWTMINASWEHKALAICNINKRAELLR